MKKIEALISQINSCDFSKIDWSGESYTEKYSDETKIGDLEDFEKKCLAFLQIRDVEHEKMHQQSKDYLNMSEKDFLKALEKAIIEGTEDLAFIKEMNKQNLACKMFQEEERIVMNLVWYSIGDRFPEKEIGAIFIRKDGILTYSAEHQHELMLRETLDNMGSMLIGIPKRSNHPFDGFTHMHFGGPLPEA